LAVSLFRFAPSKNLVIAMGAALLSVAVSALMNVADAHVLRVFLRQLVQVIGIGLVVPFLVLHQNGEFRHAGTRLDHPVRYVGISCGIAVLLFFQMAAEIGSSTSGWKA
jgi:hypothetical protein